MMKPGREKKTASKGKQRIQIAYIEDKEKRQVTFSKRKGGLLKKVSELHLLSGAHVAIVIFSQKQDANPAAAVAATTGPGGGRRRSATRRSRGGNVFAMGAPSVDHVVSRLAAASVPIVAGAEPYRRRRAAFEQEDAAVAAGREGAEATARRRDLARGLVDAEGERMKAVAEQVWRATPEGRFWWVADVAALGEAELPEFGGALKRLRDNVRRHADKLLPQSAVSGQTQN